MDKGPIVWPVIVPVQVAVAVFPPRLHVAPPVKVTVPVGVVGLVDWSVTVAVHPKF